MQQSLSLDCFLALLLEPCKDVSEGRRQSDGWALSLELHIRPHGDLLINSVGDVLKMLVGDVPWHYI